MSGRFPGSGCGMGKLTTYCAADVGWMRILGIGIGGDLLAIGVDTGNTHGWCIG